VVIDKMKFGAVPAGLHPGDVIVWENRDIFRHTATAKDGSFNIDLPARTKGKTVIRKAGTIPFTCKYHPGMKGVLKVAAK
jgi:plastocyanin